MIRLIRHRARIRTALTYALLCALLPITSAARSTRGRTNVASSGALGWTLSGDPTPAALRAQARRRLAEHAQGTYIGEMLAERDSSLARWPERAADPLTVWVQPHAAIEGWTTDYVADVRRAFREWNDLHLPVRFAFTGDSAAADVHVAFIHHFDEEISGRTNWARDDDWWITDGDIVLALYHRGGAMLDDDSMHAMTLHEVGHLIGLDHTTDSTSVMASRVRVRMLSQADRATAHLLYSLPPGGVR